MTNYQKIKTELLKSGCKTKHFTRAFFDLYTAARKQIEKNDGAGIDTRYTTPDGITTRREYDGVRASKFYTENGGAYCIFLEIASAAGI